MLQYLYATADGLMGYVIWYYLSIPVKRLVKGG